MFLWSYIAVTEHGHDEGESSGVVNNPEWERSADSSPPDRALPPRPFPKHVNVTARLTEMGINLPPSAVFPAPHVPRVVPPRFFQPAVVVPAKFVQTPMPEVGKPKPPATMPEVGQPKPPSTPPPGFAKKPSQPTSPPPPHLCKSHMQEPPPAKAKTSYPPWRKKQRTL